MYPGMTKTAREEGFDEIADWFETLAKADVPMPIASRRPWTPWMPERGKSVPRPFPEPSLAACSGRGLPGLPIALSLGCFYSG